MWKRFVTDYLNFTKKERTGILVLLLLIAFFITIPFLFPFFIHQQPTDDVSFKKEISTLIIKQADSTNKFSKKNFEEDGYQNYRVPSEKNSSKQTKGELFNFDPNTLDKSGWQRLGIKDKTIATIQNFIKKGGKFYKPADIGKIWGLHQDEVEKLIPFVQIENNNANNYPEKKIYQTTAYEKPKYTPSIIDINTADTTALIALPGIGSKLSFRILTFRDKLGGFYKVEQIAETFGLPDSTFQKIKARLVIKNSELKTININTATVDEMKTHPYLRYNIANAILQFRTQHGSFAKVDDLKKIILISDEIYTKVIPYIRVQ